MSTPDADARVPSQASDRDDDAQPASRKIREPAYRPSGRRGHNAAGATTPPARQQPVAASPNLPSGIPPLNVLIIERDHLSRLGLRQVIAQATNLHVVEMVGTIFDAEQLPVATTMEIVLLSASVADVDGGRGITRLLTRFTSARVVMLGTDNSPPMIGALRHGADGYLPRDIAAEALVSSLHAVAGGEVALSRSDVQLLVRALRIDRRADTMHSLLVRLTPRERDVLAAMSLGHHNAQIADHLGVKESTIDSHIASILRKSATPARKVGR